MLRNASPLSLSLSLLLCCCACALAFAAPVGATVVYHSPNDDGLPGATQIPEGGVQSVYLYIDGGPGASAGGEACDVGGGDEVCGYDLEITALNGLTLSAFTPDVGADLMPNFSAGSLKLNGLDSVAPTPGPHRVGELLVNAAVGGEVELTSGEVVGADLVTEVLAASTLVTVPEPGVLLALGSGVLLLAGLARLDPERCRR